MDFQKFIGYIGKNLEYFSVEEIRFITNGEYNNLLKSLNQKYVSEQDKKRKKKIEEIVSFLYDFLEDYEKNAYKYNYEKVKDIDEYIYWFDYYISNHILEQAEEVFEDIKKNFPREKKKIGKIEQRLINAKKTYQKEYKKIKEKEKQNRRLSKIEKLMNTGEYGEAMYEALRYLQKYPNDSKVNEYLTKIDKLKSSNIINEIEESENFFEKAGLLNLTKKTELKRADIKEIYQKLNVLLKKKDFDSGLKLINFLREKYNVQDVKIMRYYNKFITQKSIFKKKEQRENYKLELNSLLLLLKNKQYRDAFLKANAILKKYPMINKRRVFRIIGKINKKRHSLLETKEKSYLSRKFSEINMRFSYMNKKGLYTFYEKMARFLKAKMDLKICLQVIYYQVRDLGLKRFVKDIIDGLDSGIKISETLNWYRQIPKLDIALVKIGENTGRLGNMFQAIHEYHKEADERKKKIKSIMLYPSIIISFAILVFILLLIFIIPKFVTFYQQLGADLPLITQKVLQLSEFLRNDWLFLVLGVVGIIIFYNIFKLTSFGKYTLGYLSLKLPVVKKIVYRKYVIYFAGNLSLLLSAGVNLLEAIDLIVSGAENLWYKDEFERIRFELEMGVSFSKAVGLGNVENVGEYSNYYIPIDFAYALDIGEQTGQLADMLGDVSERYDYDLKMIINNLQSLIEPFVIIIVGLVIFVFVLSVFLPLINMYDLIGEMGGI